MQNDFLEYYGKYNISPVRQNLDDMCLHLRRREKLYRQLGIPNVTFQKAKILEVGPGSGYNTLAFLKWGAIVEMVEPNKRGLEDIKELFRKYEINEDQYEIHACTIEDFTADEKYDIIIAEGFLHSIDNSPEIIRKLTGMVNPGGCIVITCMDEFSVFVETVKRLLGSIITKDINDYETRVKVLTEFFDSQFKRLNGMSRSVEDWVRDDMINPAFVNPNLLSIGRAIEVMPQEFTVQGSSQNIFTDYSWYKDLAYDDRENCLKQFKMKQHNFLMTDLKEETILSIEKNEFASGVLKTIRQKAKEYEETFRDVLIVEVVEALESLLPIMDEIGMNPAKFVREAVDILKNTSQGTVRYDEYEVFFHAVGRTQQYLSIVKNFI